MRLKDYYRILELDPAATLPEIKKAYRRLALQFHPDKNAGEPLSIIRFAEIKEAYEVLSNPLKKNFYLQQRWYQQSIGRKKFQPAFTPAYLLEQVLELERYVSKLDAHRMDRQGLLDYSLGLVPDEVIEKLNMAGDEPVNRQIIQDLLRSAHHLSLNQLMRLGEQVKKITPLDFSGSQTEKFIEKKKRHYIWERSRIWLVMLTVILLCLVIFFATRN